MTIADGAKNSGQQSEEEAVWIWIVDPVIPDHRIALPGRYVGDEIYVRILMVVNLLPTTIDVTENIG